MNRFSRLMQLIKRQCSWSGGSRRGGTSRYARRRLFLEPLQPREVLAVAVDAFTPTPSGFVAELSAEIRQSTLNLYDTQSHALGAADVTLTGNTTGNIRGSLVVEGTTLTFIATGGALPTDTYTATLRSAANGIVDQALGELLDGEFNGSFPSGNGVPGGDFNFTFSVTANPLVVSIPDFARGPEQSVQVPAKGSGVALPAGLPIQLNDANGVTSLTVRINYNPALLTITGAELGPDAPQGSQIQANVTVPGQITVAFFALDPMSSGAADIINLIATVPETATYGATQVVDITFLDVNAGELQATADDALHVVAFPGDANANRRYDAEDARLIARTGIGLDSGFVTSTPTTTATTRLLYPTVDAVIIGDVTGVDGLSPLDASDVLRAVVGLPTPNLPAIPAAQAPTALNLSATSIAEHQPSGTLVGSFATTDPDMGDTHTYTLVAGTGDTNNSLFTISGAMLRTAASFDHATQGTLNVRVRTTDSTGRFLERTFAIAVNDVNEAPTALSISNNTVAENTPIGTSVGTFTTTDPDANNTHTYTLVTGAGATDNASFTIVGNELRVAATLDFETQASYSVRVRTTDQGGLSFDQILAISITNVNEAPTSLALSSSSVAEDQAIGTVVGSFTTTDQDSNDTHTYSLVAGTGDVNNGSFSINGNQLLTAEVFDQATKASYSIRVQSMDAGGLSVQQMLTITVTAVNSAPTAVALSNTMIDENVGTGTAVGTFSTTDPDATDTHTYTLVAGPGDADNASFTISGDQLLTAASLDFETQDTYTIRVQSTDPFGLSVEEVVTITINDVNEAPTEVTLSNTSVSENAVVGTAIGILTTLDPDVIDAHSYTLVAGDGDADNASFTIVGNELQTAVTLDFETQSAYSVRVRSMDQGGLTIEQAITINVTDVNEAPTAIAINRTMVAEAEPVDTLVGLLSTTDQDSEDTHTYSLVAGVGDTDNASFTINGDQLLTAEIFDRSTKDTYSIRVQSSDAGGLMVEEVLTITITEANVAPTALALSSSSVDENVDAGTVVGTFSTTDDNATDTHTYTLVAGPGDTDNASFTISGDQLLTVAPLDFETQDTYSIRVQSTDPFGLFVEEVLTITVNDLNEAPTAVALSNDTVAEDAAIGLAVGTLSTTDPDGGNTHTYTLVAGDGDTDNASFTIVGDELRTAVTLDFETQATYSIRIESMDQDGLTVEQMLTITVTNVNEDPTAIAISSTTVASGEAVDTVVGILTTTDPDNGDTHTYSFVAGTGDTDNTSFTINGDQLLTAEIFDRATKDTYSIRIQSTDQGGLMVEETLTITITEANVAPTALALSSSSVDENVDAGAVVGTFSTTDANVTDTHTYTLVAGPGDTDNASFTINGDQLLTAASFDFETQDSYSIRVQSTDPFGLFVEEVLTITVNDLNEAPTAVALSNNTVAEDAVIGSAVGTLSTTDPDGGNTHTYSLVAGEGDTDNASFMIVGGELQTAVALDFETQTTYSIRIESMDQGGLTVEQMLTVTVTNVNEEPTAIALSNMAVSEGEPVDAVVGTLTTTDPDSGDTHTYSLVPGNGDEDNASFTINGDQLLTAEIFDRATKDTYSIRVQSTDAGGLSVEETLTITITEVNVAPTAVDLSNSMIDENVDLGTAVGTLSTSDANTGDTHTYLLVAGAGDTDNASFTIAGDQLLTAAAIDFEAQSSYSIRVQSTDSFGATVEQVLIINVNDVNEAPTAIALSNDTVAEDVPMGTAVGVLTTTDPDSASMHTYSLVAGDGDTDNAAFEIVGDELRTAVELDFETQETYTIRVRSMDQDGEFFEQMFTIFVSDVVE